MLSARGSLEGRFGKAKPSMVASTLLSLALKSAHIKWKRTIILKSLNYWRFIKAASKRLKDGFFGSKT